MNKVKVISIRQPWAHAIIHGVQRQHQRIFKDIENRTQRFKLRGPLYIHACGRPWEDANGNHIKNEFWHRFGATFPITQLQFGMIIGRVDVVDCTQDTESMWYEGKEVNGRKNYGLVLSNPVALDEPIPVRGKLGLWSYELEDITA